MYESLTVLLFLKLVADKDVFCGFYINTYGALTPRAKEFMISEDWDEKGKLSIKFIIGKFCRDQIGVTSAGPGSADCFSCKLQFVTVTHHKSQFKVPINHWFIQAGPRSDSGPLYFPRLPSIELGEIVPKLFEARVSDSQKKVVLQWVNDG